MSKEYDHKVQLSVMANNKDWIDVIIKAKGGNMVGSLEQAISIIGRSESVIVVKEIIEREWLISDED